MMQALNLPPYDHKVSKREGKVYIWDQIRKKYLRLTPEEWVRQHFIAFLLSKGYSKGRIGVETGVKVNQLQRRSDIVVYDKEGKPYLLIECKAPSVKLTNETFGQAAQYNVRLKAPYLCITNGLQHYSCSIDFAQKNYKFLADIPEPQ
ncbi:type I restriction enzyme HsdR N-terminal domain-containing protein [Algivirga pacifica]|uniref:Type I restriction enzyme HsdR N-terminal domain-containing protein n=1 Tax=Algivirga pacifica TaxID=1162670 RepID=A0ABP9DBJ0_9BACT